MLSNSPESHNAMLTNKDVINKYRDQLLELREVLGKDAIKKHYPIVFQSIGLCTEYGMDRNLIKKLFEEGEKTNDYYPLARAMCDFLLLKFPQSKSVKFSIDVLESTKTEEGLASALDLPYLSFKERPKMIQDLENTGMKLNDIFDYLDHDDSFNKNMPDHTARESQIIDFNKKAEVRHEADIQKAEEIKHRLLGE